MARLQDFQSVTPSSSDNLLIVQATGQGLVNYGSTIGNKALKSDLAAPSITGSTNNTGSTISAGTFFYLNGSLVRAKSNIANGATLTSGTNYETVTAGGLNEVMSFYKLITITKNDSFVSTTELKCAKYGQLVVVNINSLNINANTGNTDILLSGFPSPISALDVLFDVYGTKLNHRVRLNTNGTLQVFFQPFANGDILIGHFCYLTNT